MKLASSNPHYRQLANPEPFSSLIPPAQGIIGEHGEGNTDLSIEVMKKIAVADASQAREIAKKLSTGNLKSDCDNIREWLYSNFQYLADESLQKIRSLSHAWHNERESGIDCKSYSVIASQVLQNLGYIHYFRRIKQPRTDATQPENFDTHYTHVYVVVPLNQKTGSLSGGYCVIDAVPATANEPYHTAKHDTKITPMKHQSLRGMADQEFADTILKNVQANGDVLQIELQKQSTGESSYYDVAPENCARAMETLQGLGCDCGSYMGNSLLGNFLGNTEVTGTQNTSNSEGKPWWEQVLDLGDKVVDTIGQNQGNQGDPYVGTNPPYPQPQQAGFNAKPWIYGTLAITAGALIYTAVKGGKEEKKTAKK